MAGFEFKADAAVAQSAGAGGGINTGVEVVKIEGAYLSQTTNGNNVMDLELITPAGAKTTIYGLCLDEKWKSGKENYDYPKWQELAAVAGMKTGATVACKRKDFNGVESDAVAFTELSGITVMMAIQVELDVYNGKEKKKRNLYRTFFQTGHSLAEKQAGSEPKQSVALATSMKDYETKDYKAFKAGGTTAGTEESAESETPVANEDLL